MREACVVLIFLTFCLVVANCDRQEPHPEIFKLSPRQQREIISRWSDQEPMNAVELNAVLRAPRVRGIEK